MSHESNNQNGFIIYTCIFSTDNYRDDTNYTYTSFWRLWHYISTTNVRNSTVFSGSFLIMTFFSSSSWLRNLCRPSDLKSGIDIDHENFLCRCSLSLFGMSPLLLFEVIGIRLFNLFLFPLRIKMLIVEIKDKLEKVDGTE